MNGFVLVNTPQPKKETVGRKKELVIFYAEDVLL